MRKLTILMVLVGLLLAVMPATATPVSDLTALAQYFPADSPLLVAVRTDDAFLETLDAVLARIGSVLPLRAPGRLSTMLDLAAQQVDPQGDFDSVFRSWLGDTAAFGVASLELLDADDPPFVVALSVTNRAEAESFVDQGLRSTGADFSVTTEGSFTLYETEGSVRNVGVLAVTDNALFIAEEVETLRILAAAESHLDSSADFTATLGALPAGDYDAVVYLDTPALMGAMFELNTSRLADEAGPMLEQMDAFLSAAAPQAMGFAVVNGSDLVIDSAQLAGDTSALAEMGFVIPTSMTAVDFSFAAHVPADAPLVILGADLAGTYDLLVENLRAATALQVEAGNEEAEDFEQGLQFIEFAVRGATGLDLQEDILGWMTGDYALFFNVNAEALGTMTASPLDFGLVFEATDPAAAQQVVAGIQSAIEQSEPENVTLSQENVAGIEALVITAVPDDSPFPVEILVGSNSEVFVIGTRHAFMAAVEPANGGLAADAAFVAAQSYFLDGAAMVFYFTPQPLLPLVDTLTTSGNDEMQEGAQFIQLLTSLMDSSSFTASWSEDGTRGRFVLALAG